MIAKIGLDKGVNTTDSPEIHVDDPENEIDDAVNPGVGPDDGVDPEICIALDGKDALTDSSRFDQEDCSQIGPVVNVKTGSGMVDSRLHLNCALGTGPAFGRDNINTVNPTETGSENDPTTNPDKIIKWSKLHGTQTNIYTGVQIITFCQKFSYAFTVSMATDTKIEHHNYCDYSLIMNIDADAMGDKTVRSLRLHHRDRHLSNCNFDIKHDISVGGMHYEGMHSKPSEKNDENDFPSIKESQTSGCIEDYSQHLHVTENTDMTLGAVSILLDMKTSNKIVVNSAASYTSFNGAGSYVVTVAINEAVMAGSNTKITVTQSESNIQRDLQPAYVHDDVSMNPNHHDSNTFDLHVHCTNVIFKLFARGLTSYEQYTPALDQQNMLKWAMVLGDYDSIRNNNDSYSDSSEFFDNSTTAVIHDIDFYIHPYDFGVIISFWCNLSVCLTIIKYGVSNRLPATTFENVYGGSTAFHSVSYHATLEIIMYLFRYNVISVFSAIYISVITDAEVVSAHAHLCYSILTFKSFIISILTSSIGAVCIFAKANKDVNRSTGFEFSAFVGGDDSNILVYTSSKFGVGTNPDVRFVLTDCSSDCDIMNMYDSTNCVVFKCYIDHSVIFSSSDVFDIHTYITSILLDCKSFSVDTISCETGLTLITNDFHHHFTTGNEIQDGPDELYCKLDEQSLETNMEICPGSALAISATIFEFETSNDCIIFSNMQTDQCTGDSNTFYEIEPAVSIGECTAATTATTTAPTTTTTTKPLLLAYLFGGG
jgi:hypothetical protein